MGTRRERHMSRALAGSVLGVLLCAAASGQAGECADGQVALRGDWGTAQIRIELADDPQERADGLMFRESLGRMEGMLFVYPTAKPVAFWMKNTLIPLDMIFVDDRGVVTLVHRNAIPHDERPVFGGETVKAVLEINGGMAATLGIDVGTELRHPAFAQADAAWPC